MKKKPYNKETVRNSTVYFRIYIYSLQLRECKIRLFLNNSVFINDNKGLHANMACQGTTIYK